MGGASLSGPALLRLTVGLMVVAGVVGVAVAAHAWRRRPAAGATSLSVLSAATAWWAFGYVIELLSPALETKLLVASLEWVGVVLAPVAWLLFALAYTGRDEYTRTLPLLSLSVVPVVTLVGVWTNPAHGLVWTGTQLHPVGDGRLVLMTHEWGPLYWVMLGYGYLLWVAGAALLVRTAVDLPAVYRLQGATLVAGALLPFAGNLLTTFLELGGATVDLTPAAFAGAGLACTVAVRRYDLLDARPVPVWVARDRVVEEMTDAVVVTDTKWRVTDLNAEAARLFDGDPAALKGRTLTAVLPDVTPPDRGERGRFEETVTRTVDGTERFFELRGTDFADAHGRAVGYVLVLRDVTETRLHRQRLEVMNRVLRHNLRTETNLLYGYADLVITDIERGATEDAAEHAATVKRHALALTSIGEKARTLDDLIETDPEVLAARAESAADLVQRVVDRVAAEHPDAGLWTGRLPDDGVHCPAALRTVLREVVENAVEHNPSPTPSVSVWTSVEESSLVVRVSDDGPGIGDDELAAIEADVETPLQHGSGVGLWLVTWGVAHLGGDVGFEEREAGGTLVTLRVPVSDPPDEASAGRDQ